MKTILKKKQGRNEVMYYANSFPITNTKQVHLPELNTKKEISDTVRPYIVNKVFITTLTDEMKYQVMINLTEYSARQNLNKTNEIFNKLYQNGNLRFKAWSEKGLEWQYNKDTGFGIINLYAITHNLSPLNAVSELTKAFGINYEYCFNMFPVNNLSVNRSNNNHDDYIISVGECEYSFPYTLEINSKTYKQYKIIPIFSISGEIDSCIIFYNYANEILSFPASKKFFYDNYPTRGYRKSASYSYHIGESQCLARLTNRIKLLQNPKAIACIALNCYTAEVLRGRFEESPAISDENVVITSFFGGMAASQIVDISDLFSREVILLIEPDRQESLEAIVLANHYHKNGVANVRIYPYPVLVERALDFEGKPSTSCPWERALIEHTKVLSDIESPSFLYKKIYELAFTVPDFITWGKEVGLFRDDRIDDDFTTEDPLIELIKIPSKENSND